MKIIQRGRPPSEREWKFTCTNCRTIFECMQSEGRLTSDQLDGDTLSIACPVCDRTCYGSPK
ncbi:RNase P subunit RPR2 [Paraburkholderia sp. Cpub6]|nr:RNase P subunit RPR2 [Paraburkholderia sp. Cpub6]